MQLEIIERQIQGYTVRIRIEPTGVALGMDAFGTLDEGPTGYPVLLDLGGDAPQVAVWADHEHCEPTDYIELAGAQMGPAALITFTPQAWIDDEAVEVDPMGQTQFRVPLADCVGMKDDTPESDVLKDHGCAPAWIRDWSGPFYITIEREEGDGDANDMG